MLEAELHNIGARQIHSIPGGVHYQGTWKLCYTVNLESRIASRVLWFLDQTSYAHEQDIYRTTFQLPWPHWFSSRATIKVKVKTKHCPLRSVNFVALRIKDAICDKFIHETGTRPNVRTDDPDIQIHAYVDQHTFTLYLDTSGAPLFKRGFRIDQGNAPLRENLAAGILALSGWTPDQTLLDPMCGSGTILLEAAQKARRIAPGLHRHFTFEKFLHFDQRTWTALRQISQSLQIPSMPITLHGYDRDAAQLEKARTNIQAAGLSEGIHLQEADALTIHPPTEQGILLTNPPYGIRSGERDQLAAFYPQLGNHLKQQFPGWQAYFLTADARLAKLIGLAASRRTPLYNGDLECRLFEFKMVRGHNRKSTRQHQPPPPLQHERRPNASHI